MVKTFTLQTNISPGREIHIKMPGDVPTGPAEVVVIIVSSEALSEAAGTAGEMLQSPLFGLWADRDDISDSIAFARRLRAQAEQRSHG